MQYSILTQTNNILNYKKLYVCYSEFMLKRNNVLKIIFLIIHIINIICLKIQLLRYAFK